MDLTFIKTMYEKYQNSNEADIQYHVITNLLILLGYDRTEFHYEHPSYHKDGRTDIAVRIKGSTFLFVEVKKPNKKLLGKEKAQLISYLATAGLEWGILTNGKEYILVNNGISSSDSENRDASKDKIVFNLDIYNDKDIHLLKYFSKKSLFENCTTNYFKHIAQYKANKYPGGGRSWNNYKGTLFDFFNYYSEKQGKYRELNQIRADEFEEYLRYEMEKKNSKSNGKKIRSSHTSNNKISHIRSFFNELNIKNNDFFNEKKDEIVFRIGTGEIKKLTEDILSDENIFAALNFYDTRRDSIRNKVIFLLCLSFGLERSTIFNLKAKDFKGGKLILEERELRISKSLLKWIEEIKMSNERKKIKGEYLFYTKYRNKYNPISEDQINYTFNILQEIDKNNDAWQQLNPAYIRQNLIKRLFFNNYPIEEIAYLTGADLPTISNIISYQLIVNQVKSRKKEVEKIHPFDKFLQ